MNEPDAIIPLSGGTVQGSDGKWRSTTYEERDAFGTLGGYVRMQAGALLARQFPEAWVIANSRCMDGREPSHAKVHMQELQTLGVEVARIILEEQSTTTGSEIAEALTLAKEREWKQVYFVSNEYHLPRIRAFYATHINPVSASFISAEAVISKIDSAFIGTFAQVKESNAYQERLLAEQRGIAAIDAGTYHIAHPQEKKEY